MPWWDHEGREEWELESSKCCLSVLARTLSSNHLHIPNLEGINSRAESEPSLAWNWHTVLLTEK